jgi:hypothetical protein
VGPNKLWKTLTSWASRVHAAVPDWLSRISGYSSTVFITCFGLLCGEGDIVLCPLLRAASPQNCSLIRMWPSKNVSHIQVLVIYFLVTRHKVWRAKGSLEKSVHNHNNNNGPTSSFLTVPSTIKKSKEVFFIAIIEYIRNDPLGFFGFNFFCHDSFFKWFTTITLT